MSVEEDLKGRSGGACELCRADGPLDVFAVGPGSDGSAAMSVYVCANCKSQIEQPATMDSDHWQVLSDTMWSETPAVQVMAWRLLDCLREETWASDLLDMLYLDEETLAWAQSGALKKDAGDAVQHVDSNGTPLAAGDTVTLIKDLNVKGASFTAKRGTAVRRISLVPDNPEHIEGRVNDQQIVILTKFVKKSG